jgi:hypothetical protein
MSIDMTIYARPAVMKALYRFHEEYIISFEREGSILRVWCESRDGAPSTKNIVADAFRELSFQMIRYDTMHSTKGVRELLVARALYATCIDDADEENETDSDQVYAGGLAEGSEAFSRAGLLNK